MSRKQPTYKIRMFLEDGTPLTKENMHMTRIKQEVTAFQAKMIIRQLNQIPEEIGRKVWKGLINQHERK